MTSKHGQIIIIGFLATLGACRSGTSPSITALDGAWSSGHSLIGVGLSLDMTWSSQTVHGTGGFAAAEGSHCGSQLITGSGTLTLSAARLSRTDVSGVLKFGETQVTYRGTLAEQPTRIDGNLIARDGSECGLTIFQGLVP